MERITFYGIDGRGWYARARSGRIFRTVRAKVFYR